MTLRAPPSADEDGYFGEDAASSYDDPDDPMFSAERIGPVVDTLVRLAQGGPALEFAIGTGRIALPLVARGIEVHGIDLSRAMVRQLRAKPGGAKIPVAIGDMATLRAPGAFTLVYLVFNTIENLTSRAAQQACFRNAAAHLVRGGRFVIEVENPRPEQLPAGQRFRVWEGTERHWGIDEYDIPNQGLVSHHFFPVGDGHWQLTSVPFRYAPPKELDEMAQQGGLRLMERWAGWNGEPFTPDSDAHVSVWEKIS